MSLDNKHWFEKDPYIHDIWENTNSGDLEAHPKTGNDHYHWIERFDKDIPTEALKLFLKRIKPEDVMLQEQVEDELVNRGIISRKGFKQLWELIRKPTQKTIKEETADDIAKLLINTYHFKNPFPQSRVVLYYNEKKGIYEEKSLEFIDHTNFTYLRKAKYLEAFSDSEIQRRASLIKRIIRADTLVSFGRFNAYPNMIPVDNGNLDISDLENPTLIPFAPEFLITSKLPVKFDPNAPSTIENNRLLKYIYDYGGAWNYEGILEAYGDALTGTPWKFQTAIMFVSPQPEAGKSTILEIFIRTVGSENISREKLKNLENDTKSYSIAELQGMLANIDSELPSKPLDETSNFKTLISEKEVSFNKKYGQKGKMANTCKLMFSGNFLPELLSGGKPEYRRMIIFKFNKSIPKKEIIGNYLDTIYSEEELSGVLNACLENLQRLRKRGHYDEKYTSKTEELYRELSNPLIPFLDTYCKFETPDATTIEYRINNNLLLKIYNAYLGSKSIPVCWNTRELSKQINRLKDYNIISKPQTRDKIRYNDYIGIKFNTQTYMDFKDYFGSQKKSKEKHQESKIGIEDFIEKEMEPEPQFTKENIEITEEQLEIEDNIGECEEIEDRINEMFEEKEADTLEYNVIKQIITMDYSEASFTKAIQMLAENLKYTIETKDKRLMLVKMDDSHKERIIKKLEEITDGIQE